MNKLNLYKLTAGIAFVLSLSGLPQRVLAVIDVSFTDMAADAGFEVVPASQGPTFFDENGDGIEDLYLAVGGFNAGDNIYYRARGDLTFEVATDEVGLTENGPSTMAVIADFNNDGLPDVYVTNHDYLGVSNHMYYRQTGGGYLDVTVATGTSHQYESHDAMAFDYDQDGWLDLFVASANHLGSEPNALFHNNGDGTFTDMAAALGVDLTGEFGMGGSAADYDNDGDPDLYVTNEYSDNVLFRNDGGTFTVVTAIAGVASTGVSKSAYFEDYDADGWLDLYVVSRFGSNQLFHNNGDGTFSDVTTSAGVSDNLQGRTMGWADFDNDGWLDIFVCNSDAPGSNEILWHNQGNGTFIDAAMQAGISDPYYSDGLAIGDPNGDGFMDIYVSNLDVLDRFYINSGNNNHWISVEPSGLTTTNRSGVGVRVTVVTDMHRQMREVQAGGGYQSSMSLPLEFGLASAASADSVILRWTDGHTEIYTDVAADQRYIAVEDSALFPFTLPDLEVSVTPTGPVILPSQGGTLDFNVSLTNNSGLTLAFDVWTEIRLPGNESFGPIIVRALNLPPTTISRNLIQNVPAGAPAGAYTYYVYTGIQSEQSIWAMDSFDFTKSGADGGSLTWCATDWTDEMNSGGYGNAEAPPQSTDLISISPNPFNLTTSITFTIPKAGQISLALFNIHGQKVLNIADGYYNAGQHQSTLDGNSLSSGMYLLHLKAPNLSVQSKVLLVK